MKKVGILMLAVLFAFASCDNAKKEQKQKTDEKVNVMKAKVDEFASVKLTTDFSGLSEKERRMIPVLIDIAKIMDKLFWTQSFGDKSLLDKIEDPYMKEFAMINYGPWDRLDGMKPFVPGYEEKLMGANFYPHDMTVEEFEAFDDPDKDNLYTVIVRDEQGKLKTVWYNDYYKAQLSKVIDLMNKAIELAEDPGLKNYLQLRVKAFQTDDYFASDMAWMDMKESRIDFVVGPIENYEDRLFGYKTAYESFVLVKDEKWSADLAKFTKMLPALQTALPCDSKFKQEVPGSDSDLNVYDAIYYGGDCNSGSKTIAINLPNDERVHLEKGARRLQLKNSMKAKFDLILMPIAELMMDQSQLKNIKFDAFFSNVTFHEVAHGLGIKNTINGKGNIREALKEQYMSWEEAKADILGLFMVEYLVEKGEITNCTVEDAYATFIAGILRSVRFGASSAHGQANMMAYNLFEDKGAFARNAEGKYLIDFEKSKSALREWAALILEVEGEGKYDFAKNYNEINGRIRPSLQADLDKINHANIPRDIRFEQGVESLEL
ncbi:MAG: Zn-dependent hydrolase [Bacteroidales bacterium]|jgi:hypothetical protein|nr:Zn-dependent hydrolase [Bacteroidales bacterium]